MLRFILFAAIVLSACALRPRYSEFVSKDTRGSEVQLRLLERKTGKPVAGAVVEVGEYRARITTKTDAEGVFALPIDRRYLDENSIIVVNPPAGVGATAVEAKPASVEPLAPVPVAAPVEPTVVAVDAGTAP